MQAWESYWLLERTPNNNNSQLHHPDRLDEIRQEERQCKPEKLGIEDQKKYPYSQGGQGDYPV